MQITEAMFIEQTKQYLSDIANEAIVQFRGGAAHDHCLKLAIDIVEARDLAKLRAKQRLADSVLAPPLGPS